MKIGTRSILWGAHCWFIHPWFVALAWWRLYGFPWDPRLWLAFFVHDLGYWGSPNMDGPEGERHVEFGAKVMHRLCDRNRVIGYEWKEFHFGQWGVPWRSGPNSRAMAEWNGALIEGWEIVQFFTNANTCLLRRPIWDRSWHDLCLFHSRYYAKQAGCKPSRLCMADKLAVTFEPWWFYLPRVWLSGELWEYMSRAGGTSGSKYNGEPIVSKYLLMGKTNRTPREWFSDMTEFCRRWVDEHQDGREDTWTPKKEVA